MNAGARRPAAAILAVLLLASALLHVYWALGGSWFLATALNMDVEQLPEGLVLVTWLFVAALCGLTAVALARVGLLGLPLSPRVLAVVLWCAAAVLLVGAVYNALIPRWWDRWVFAPCFLMLTALTAVVAWPGADDRR